MKKNLLRMICCIAIVTMASMQLKAAVTDEIEKIVVELTNDNLYVYKLSEKPVVTFDDNSVKVASSVASATYVRSEVKNFHFGDATVTDIQSVSKKQITLTYLDNENVSITGEGLQGVTLYNAEGKLLDQPQVQADGVSVSLKGYAPGVYILNVPNHTTYKIIKK